MAITHGGNIFEVAAANGWDWRDIADFSASINPLGPAPGVAAAIENAISRIVHYPDRGQARLRQALAAAWNIGADQILPGNGATELIFFLARMFAGHKVTLALPMFQEFHRAFANAGTVLLADGAAWPRSGILCLTRPANPTGETVSLNAIENRLRLSEDPLLVDESFIEYASSDSALTLMGPYPHLIVLRSLTKFYALPGVRVGAVVASPDFIRAWESQREPWQVNVLAEEAAIAALADEAYRETSKAFLLAERAWLFAQLCALRGIKPAPGEANYLHVRLTYPAGQLAAHMLRKKILIRDCSAWPGLTGSSVRVAVRRRQDNERLIQAWKEYPCD